MGDASRFPHLAPPFAIVGAAAGWLSAGLVANPLVHQAESGVQGVAALFAMVAGAVTGLLLTRWCVRRRYRYELEEVDPLEPVPTDRWWRHVPVVLAAGAGTGASIAVVEDVYHGPMYGALGGFLCALVFVPVCVAVILAARRARRARLGSIVAASDRRAVWGILATTLAVATLEAAPDWPASLSGHAARPWVAIGMLGAAAALIGAILAIDLRALRAARAAVGSDLSPRDPSERAEEDAAVPKVDLGLGDDVSARVARSASAYRGRDRTLALVQGSPQHAFSALERAIRRGRIGLLAAGGVLGVHVAANGEFARRVIDDELCAWDDFEACVRLASVLRDRRPGRAAVLYERACEGFDALSCAAAARMHEGGEGIVANWERARQLHQRACEQGVASSCPATRGPSPSF